MAQATTYSAPFVKKYKDPDGTDREYKFRVATTYNYDDSQGLGGKVDKSNAVSVLELDTGSPILGGHGWTPGAQRGKDGNWNYIKDATTGNPILGTAIRNDLSKSGPNSFNNQINNHTAYQLSHSGVAKSTNDAYDILNQSQQVVKPASDPATEGSTISVTDADATTIANDLGNVEGATTGLPGAGKNLYYPLSLQSTKQDRIVFTQIEYSPKTLGTEDNPLKLGERSTDRVSQGSVHLPIQGQIGDQNTVTWGNGQLNPAEIALADAFLKGVTGKVGDAFSSLETSMNTVLNNKEGVKGAIATILAGQAIGSGENLLTRTTGAIINPNVELLFTGPQLRPFTFVFKMSARSKNEGDQIKKIIYFFKKGMAVKRTKNGFFLKSPNTFQINYQHLGEDHKAINKIKECALQSCTVNYTPDGYYASHADGNLVSYEINLQFSELEPVFYDDYKETDTVGY